MRQALHGAVEQIPGASPETDGCMAVPNPVQSARELGLRCTTAFLKLQIMLACTAPSF